MSEVVSSRPQSATAEDTLKQKTRGAGIASDGHLHAPGTMAQTMYK
jgi:acetolactate synthase-1/2/3 large subunit